MNHDLKLVVEKISSIYGKKASVKAMSSGRVKVLIEFESIDKVHEFVKEKYPVDLCD